MPEYEVTLWKNWTDVDRDVDQAGRNLHVRFRGTPIATKQFKEEIAKISKYASSGTQPTDYSYNLLNEGEDVFLFPLFECLERGSYRYLGPNFEFDGPITWKPSGGDGTRIVGRWEKGRCYLQYDPRAARAKRRS